ncbi:urea transport system ATP-binding protein [Bosea sp. CRIB-10]|jgi:urea transport system ATP-binding protein|uniref:urea ABC transporter ATP-binding subunit UrtE n=1 Tax=Bosea sp. CRIB-10 TaxID=378404 RepID=UPI0008F2296E|nr:urea ABC transporter ATP-binding subunit UrtE [Bosea sp. CRIB-10]PZR94242.1 MAG: urea ABC transporter ATP-binding subunit UrtE [Stutzerimonas stutzeri]SFD55234.1 urea transport system ATP-binding protein [Bosea sp. CRIB-10]
MLELSNVDGFYGRSRALQSVSLSVGKSEFVSVLGRNGVGKTTLLRTILGLMSKTSGSIRLDGSEIGELPTHRRAKAGLGYVPQGRGILPDFTVRENLLLGTYAAETSERRIQDYVFELFPILRDFLSRRGGNLSGGQQQQLAIARALLSQPKILLLDEPTEGIQPNIVEQIEDILIDLNRKRGLSIILVEQNITFARRASHRFAMLNRGSVAVSDRIEALSDDLIHRYLVV